MIDLILVGHTAVHDKEHPFVEETAEREEEMVDIPDAREDDDTSEEQFKEDLGELYERVGHGEMGYPAMQMLHVGLIHLPWASIPKWIARKEDPSSSSHRDVFF